ncbi:MAG: 6-hydroxymethylpterin diphosphokinase MptE-like protein [Candidatus Hadarchaeales archaeon]
MRWEVWHPRYETIVKRLGLDPVADAEAAKALDGLLPDPDLEGMANILRGRECVVFGAGPSLDEDLIRLERAGYLEKVLIAADGATSAVIEYRRPDIIVTDLDGKVEDQLRAWRLGSWLVVHAHGDNLEQVRDIAPTLKERVIGTTQVEPFGRLHNFGGFTDGDRAAFMAHELGASRIYLAGMNLGRQVGKHSGDKDLARKVVKLAICKELLAWLAGELGARLVNLTGGGEDIPNVPREAFSGKLP